MTNQNNLENPSMLNQHEFKEPCTVEFISKLTQLISIERIYMCHCEWKGNPVMKITILIPGSAKMHITAASALTEMVMSDYPEFKFEIFYIEDVRRALRYGNLVFYTICKEVNLVYQSDRYNSVLSGDVSARSALRRAKRSFKKEWKKVENFRAGFNFYFGKKNYAFAAFMVHQMFELSYRTVELLLIGKENFSHSIRNHQKMNQHVPVLGTLFKEGNKEEETLLDLLDAAYRSVRYEQDYKIELHQLLIIWLKAERMELQVFALCELIVGQFKDHMEAVAMSEVTDFS